MTPMKVIEKKTKEKKICTMTYKKWSVMMIMILTMTTGVFLTKVDLNDNNNNNSKHNNHNSENNNNKNNNNTDDSNIDNI